MHTLLREILLAFFGWAKYVLENQRSTLLACTDLVDQDLRADILELITCACWASLLWIGTSSLIFRVTLGEVAQHFFSILIDAVQEEILNLDLV